MAEKKPVLSYRKIEGRPGDKDFDDICSILPSTKKRSVINDYNYHRYNYLVAYRDNVPAGYVKYHKFESLLVSCETYVKHGFRRAGIAEKMGYRMIGYARSIGAELIRGNQNFEMQRLAEKMKAKGRRHFGADRKKPGGLSEEIEINYAQRANVYIKPKKLLHRK